MVKLKLKQFKKVGEVGNCLRLAMIKLIPKLKLIFKIKVCMFVFTVVYNYSCIISLFQLNNLRCYRRSRKMEIKINKRNYINVISNV